MITTGVKIPGSGGTGIRTQALVPQPFLPLLPLPRVVTLHPGKLGSGGCRASSARVWGTDRPSCESQLLAHPETLLSQPVPHFFHLFIGDSNCLVYLSFGRKKL